ncbi:MAG: LPXTG cell wall anchor domain-containing protein, partial [Brevibacterium aurantiacum]
VTPKGNSNVTAYDNTVKADDEGNASVNVYGTSANDPSAYLGDYDVTVTCGDDELTGAFTVSDDANAGGSDGNEDGNEDGNADGGNGGDDDGNGSGGGDLPRTGTELTGLVGGAALLLIGGAAVTMTMRRKKAVEDPSAI